MRNLYLIFDPSSLPSIQDLNGTINIATLSTLMLKNFLNTLNSLDTLDPMDACVSHYYAMFSPACRLVSERQAGYFLRDVEVWD